MRKEYKMADKPPRGLADIVAASTAVSDIDGVFSVSRMAGWTAHVIEQHADNRLIRPDSEYIGERGLTWVPVGQR
jgi:hypothetical protein